MERAHVLLQALQMKLRGWIPVIKRSTYADDVDLVPGEKGTFFLKSSGRNRDGSTWEFSRHFDNPYCFGDSTSLSPLAWSVKQRPCEFAREYIRDVLRQRGALQ